MALLDQYRDAALSLSELPLPVSFELPLPLELPLRSSTKSSPVLSEVSHRRFLESKARPTGRKQLPGHLDRSAFVTTVERDVCGGPIIGEFDIKRRRVWRKCKARRDEILIAGGIIHSILCIVNSKAVTCLERAEVGEIVSPPERKARRISVIATVGLLRRTVIVQLLSGVVVVNILALALQLVNRILDGPDATGGRMLGDANGITQTPANHVAICVVDPIIVLADEGKVEATDLRAT
ncbi:unnamed protein product [Clonostachys rosea]|uniref:Uncharacterized protein n=1 Tax=Bionectria ochroleuca TaxID=29856 RepID=A0ABY6UG64_BIOOC|nr:unnamed protein product [Clonostachys rosea]